MHSSLRRFVRNCHHHSLAVATFSVVALVLLAATVEQYGVLPLQGQATPIYTPLPVKNTGRKGSVSKTSRSTTSRAPNRLALRSSSTSSVLHAGPASSVSSASVSSAKWTGAECPGYGAPPAACQPKMLAMATGDYSCLADKNCWAYYRFTCTLTKENCAKMATVQWLLESFLPECFGNVTPECDAARQYFVSASVPTEVKTCLQSTICRELLSTFRSGSLSCRQYEPCLAALEVIVKSPTCSGQDWCNRMANIHSAITNGAINCKSGYNDDCRRMLRINSWAVVNERVDDCWVDGDCMKERKSIVDSLMGKNDTGPIIPACFLWSECRDEFLGTKRWACEVGMRTQQCEHAKAVYEFLTVTKPSCVTSGESSYCQQSIKNLLQ